MAKQIKMEYPALFEDLEALVLPHMRVVRTFLRLIVRSPDTRKKMFIALV